LPVYANYFWEARDSGTIAKIRRRTICDSDYLPATREWFIVLTFKKEHPLGLRLAAL